MNYINTNQKAKMKQGGKRKGAGRKPSLDKKQTVVLYIETSIINSFGGMDAAKEKLYNFVKIVNNFKL